MYYIYVRNFGPFKIRIEKKEGSYIAEFLYRRYDVDHLDGIYNSLYVKEFRNIKDCLILFRLIFLKIKESINFGRKNLGI